MNIADELLAAAAEREARQIDEKLPRCLSDRGEQKTFLEICATPPAASPKSAGRRR